MQTEQKENEAFVINRLRPINQTSVVQALLDANDKGFEIGPSSDDIQNRYPAVSDDELEELKETYPHLWKQFEKLELEDQSRYNRGFWGFLLSRGAGVSAPDPGDGIREWHLIDSMWAEFFLKEGEAILKWANQCWWGRRVMNQSIHLDPLIKHIRARVGD